jgi:pentatricopeptide repeat protein
MTRTEKEVLKKKNTKDRNSFISYLILSAILLCFSFLFRSDNVTSLTVFIFSSIVIIVAGIYAIKIDNNLKVFNRYRRQLLEEKEHHYLNKIRALTKNNKIDEAISYYKLLKSKSAKTIMLGFIESQIYDTKGTESYNAILLKILKSL